MSNARDEESNGQNRKLVLRSLDFWRQDPERTPLLDVRSTPTSTPGQQECDDSITVAHIPLADLSSRNFELPPRNVRFAVLFDNSCNLDALEEILLGRKPWKVVYGINTSDKDQALLEIPNSLQQFPKPRLWEPDTMVRDVLLPVLLERTKPAQEIWDLGAGAGRDVCFLAESLPQATTVVAFDHRYRNETDPIHAFFERRGVAKNTKVCCTNVANISQFTCDCLYMVRYWNRTLVQRISEQARSSTVVAVSQFGKPHVGADWPFAHPKVRVSDDVISVCIA